LGNKELHITNVDEAPKNVVSVFVLVYNQEQIIEQTLNSILSQKTNFPFNLVIGEDCSTDKTLDILKKFQSKYPNQIKLISSEKNVGLIHNFMRTINHCDGKYIAICDGDDYWIYDKKLQEQVNFLEFHSDFSIVFTRKQDLLEDGKMVVLDEKKPEISAFDDLVKSNYIPSVTALFRNKISNKKLPNWILKYPYGDWPLYLWLLADGSKIAFIDKITATYRKGIGESHKLRKNLSTITNVNLNILQDLHQDSHFNNYRKSIKKSIQQHKIQLFNDYNREGKYFLGFKVFLKLMFQTNIFIALRVYLYSLKKHLLKID
jgi:glycosyltransferase involved in cell wall biosynthesis